MKEKRTDDDIIIRECIAIFIYTCTCSTSNFDSVRRQYLDYLRVTIFAGTNI